MAWAIECRQVTCRYGATKALRAVDLALPTASWTALLGPSGSGKTTLLRVMAGLEPLAGGEVRIAGEIATNHEVRLAPHRRGVGLMFQEPSLWPHLSALENVALGVSPAASGFLARRERRAEAMRWLERFGMGAAAARPPGELSGGEARRVTLARTLAARPMLLLLDEPTAHLDLHLREELMGLLRRLHAELGLTTLCVTHQIEPPMRPDDRLIILESGAIDYDGDLAGLARDAAGALRPPSPFREALRRALPPDDRAWAGLRKG